METNKNKQKNKKKEKKAKEKKQEVETKQDITKLEERDKSQIPGAIIEKQSQDESIGQAQFINKKLLMTLINQQEKSLCRIMTKKGILSGFLCHIPNPVLVTSNDIFDEEEINHKKMLTIYFNGDEIVKKIIIDKNRKICSIGKTNDGVEINSTIIEIKPDKDELLEQEFLELDDNLLNNNIEYESKNIYLIYYKSGDENGAAFGNINAVKKNLEIEHDAEVDYSSAGCPILIGNNKVIAVQGKINLNEKFNKGILLNFLINEYKEKYENKNIINGKEESDIINEEKEKIENSNENVFKQIIPQGSAPLINGNQAKIINEQMKKKLCKIYMKNGGFGSGFFCKIPFPNKFNLLTVLFTNNHVLGENDIKNGEIIKFTLGNDAEKKEISIDNSRKTYTNKDLDTTIIELKSDEIEIGSFLEVDDTSFNLSSKKKENEKKEIYLIQYPGGGKYAFSTGIIKRVDDYNIEHLCSTKNGSSGGAILSLLNFSVIGIHKESSNFNFNLGTLIKIPIKEFNKKFKNIIYVNSKVTMIYKIGNSSFTKLFSKSFVENNKENCKMLIKEKEYDISELLEFSKYNINKNNEQFLKKILTKINAENITNLSFMFAGCFSLISVYFESFNTENVTDMCCMFQGCNKLTFLNLDSFNTENVTDMHCMFESCFKLTFLNLDSFNTENSTNMSRMFYDCCRLTTLNLGGFNTQNVTDMAFMFAVSEKKNSSLIKLDLSSFNTEKVTDMHCMFLGCSKLKFLNLKSFKVRNANIEGIFDNCQNLLGIQSSEERLRTALEFEKEKFINNFTK